MSQTVRIDALAHAALAEVAKAKHIPLTEALSRAVEALRKEVFLDGLADDFAALRRSGDWVDEQAERRAWAKTDTDGIEDE